MTTAPQSKARPIIFSAEMIRAILDGRKVVTRRIVKPQPVLTKDAGFAWKGGVYGKRTNGEPFTDTMKCPYGVPGDVLWVKESWWPRTGDKRRSEVLWKATDEAGMIFGTAWRSSRFMPRWASRITLTVVNRRIERVQDLTDAEAKLEGFPIPGPQTNRLTVTDKLTGKVKRSIGEAYFFDAKSNFVATWQALNAKRGYPYSSNPFVWRVEFRVAEVYKRPEERRREARA
jgi:hypothetical protein